MVAINPFPCEVSPGVRAADRVGQFVAYLLGRSDDFPECTFDELVNAVAAVRLYNKQRYFDNSVVLWPSEKMLKSAYTLWAAGDPPENWAPVMIKATEEGELYLDF